MLENAACSEFEEADLNEKKQAINLALTRYPWWINPIYFYKALVPQAIVFVITMYLVVSIDTVWILPTYIISIILFNKLYFKPLLVEQIKPHLKQALADVRLNKYR